MKYSRSPFEGWKYRAKFEYTTNKVDYIQSFDVYTNNTDKQSVFELLRINADRVLNDFKLIHWVSKEQDDLTNKFIESLEL